MYYLPLSCTSSPCHLLFFNLGASVLVQATVGVGTVLIWYFGVADTKGGGVQTWPRLIWGAWSSLVWGDPFHLGPAVFEGVCPSAAVGSLLYSHIAAALDAVMNDFVDVVLRPLSLDRKRGLRLLPQSPTTTTMRFEHCECLGKLISVP